MPNPLLPERFTSLSYVRKVPRVSSGSPRKLTLRPEREDVAVILAVLALAKRGLSLLTAKQAIEAMIDEGEVIVELPTVESSVDLAADLKRSGVSVISSAVTT
jgi:putative transcriptional regulator